MTELAVLFQTAQQHHRAGQLREAEKLYQTILEQDGSHADAIEFMGILYFQRGELDQAIIWLRQALTLKPQAPHYHNNLANAYQRTGHESEAIYHYQEALKYRPDFAEAYNNLGNIYQAKQAFQEAIAYFQDALKHLPHQPSIHYNLANTFFSQGQFAEAIQSYQSALQLNPNYLEAWQGLAVSYKSNGEGSKAIESYKQLLTLKPSDSSLYFYLGHLYQQEQLYQLAIEYYLQALQLKPEDYNVLINLGLSYQQQGRVQEAITSYQQAYQLNPSDLLKLRLATILPAVYQSQEELNAWHQRFSDQVHSLLQQELVIPDVFKDGSVTNFYLNYMGFNDYELQLAIAQIYLKACPALGVNLVSPNKAHSRTKTKIGLISKHFSNHSIGNFIKGIILHLSRDLFEVIVFSLVKNEDQTTELLKVSAEQFIQLPQDLEDARQLIAREELDILFYPDIGMEPMTYFLAFARLAPVQCVAWGHGVTTGIPNLDYFFSTTSLEGGDPQSRYSEKLILMDNLLPYYFRPPKHGLLKSRQDFGFSAEDHLYCCPQNIFKFHPEFDEFLREILIRDPKGKLILLEGIQPYWNKQLQERFKHTLSDVLAQIVWLPRQRAIDFVNLIEVSDVMLDPLHLGGGNTCLDAFTTGAPIVTLPSGLAKGRITYALYQQMGVMDCVVNTKEEYIQLALRLASEPDFRQSITHKILQNCHKIYENMEAVREFEQCLLKLTDQQELYQLEILFQEGVNWHKQGQLDLAQERYQQILQAHPQHAETLHMLGILHFHFQQNEQAIEYYQAAISLSPFKAPYHNNLANTFSKLGRHAEAIEHYKEALKLNPSLADAHSNLGQVYFKHKEWRLALEHFQQALSLKPNTAHYYTNLGNLWYKTGKIEQAIQFHRQALTLEPFSVMFHINLAIALQLNSQFQEAYHHLETAIQLQPEEPIAYLNLGLLQRELGEYERAKQTFLRVLEINSSYQKAAYLHLSEVVFNLGEIEAAKQALEQALNLDPEPAIYFRLATFLPPVYQSQEELNWWRQRLEREVQTLLSQELKFEDSFYEQVLTHFYLSYQGLNDRQILNQIAQVFRPFLPETVVANIPKSSTSKIKVGFASRYFCDHSVNHCFESIYLGLSKEKFEVVLLVLPGTKKDSTTQRLKASVDGVIELPSELSAIRQEVANQHLDILVYPEIGMDNLTYFLAFTRLAPVQCVLTGHPDTSGLSTIDYSLSWKSMEIEAGQEFYTEKLIQFEHRFIHYQRPQLPSQQKTKAELGLAEDKNLYICPMTLFKMHPDFDRALKGILERDPQAEIYLFKDAKTGFHQLLQTRFNSSLGKLQSRIKWLGWQSREDFLRILDWAGVVLDTFHFGAGNTAFITLALGSPMVTLPSDFARGRCTYSLYSDLGLMDCVATSEEEYIDLACKIAMNPALRHEIKTKILSRSQQLFQRSQ